MLEEKNLYQTNNHSQKKSKPSALPVERQEVVNSWGGANANISYVYRPTTIEGVQEVLTMAQRYGRTIGLRGGGNSYGDAAMNGENILLDMRRMNRILSWNPSNGRVVTEPGVTISQLWQYVLEDGWWPPVVTGTSKTTIGGCAAMNVHGKNAWQVGPIGDHIISFDMLLPSGKIITCSRNENADVFYAAIGGFGMLGIFTSITLQMKRIYSGNLQVHTQAQKNLTGMFNYFNENLEKSNYIVGWIDAFAKGDALGRGDVHRANYLPPGADPEPQQSLRLENQHLTPNMFGVLPRSIIWLGMRPFMNNFGTALVNRGKFITGRIGGVKSFQQSHAAFHFLLDYVPDWKNAYGSGGLIQYQPFIPKETAHDAFKEMLRLCQRRGIINYLTVFKRHRPDNFLMSHGLDGFSLAMDFRITEKSRSRVAMLARELDEIVLAANGRFYFAKDSTLRPEVAEAYLGKETIAQFTTLKHRCDPNNLLETDLWRRVFG
ncbi:MAG: FAD-binding oxidoreductase [Anaerolineales bacterium]|nr:FAD-binding oxidoreductase [Anaerolineales bacterium]